jgi:hypothetical protein
MDPHEEADGFDFAETAGKEGRTEQDQEPERDDAVHERSQDDGHEAGHEPRQVREIEDNRSAYQGKANNGRGYGAPADPQPLVPILLRARARA